jgi:multidrug resistance protein, MATE family
MVFLGRLEDADFIGAATLGNMMCNITGFSLAFGLCSALDTLISQAYGAKLYKLTGLHTQRAIVILTLCTMPVYFLWLQTGWILHNVLFINKTVSDLAGQWSKIIAIGLWPSVVFEILRKFLQGQQIIWPVVVASMLATTSNIVSNFVLVEVYHYGFRGPAISVALANWVALTSLTTIILLRRWVMQCRRRRRGTNSEMVVNYEMVEMDQMTATGTEIELPNVEVAASDRDVAVPETDSEDNWPILSRNIFLDWGSFLSLGVPGALSLFFEWGSFELVASIAGQLDPVRLATHGVFMSTCGLFYMAPQAIAGATATIAGNYLGENLPVEAKFIIDLGICVDFLWGLVSGLILIFLLRPVWGAMYTDEVDVQDMIKRSLPIMFLYVTVDSTKCITLNILRSIGRPGVTVIGNIISCIFVMLPLGYLLTLKLNLGLTGLWLAMSIAWLVATLVYLYIIVRTDWQQQADIARDRNESASGKSHYSNYIFQNCKYIIFFLQKK